VAGGLPDRVGYAPVTVPGLISVLAGHAGEFGRTDLAGAARWLAAHPPAAAPDVICHGDLHPFNLLADGDRITVLDWSTTLIAPRAHDVGFTSLLLSEPPLDVPAGPARPSAPPSAACWPGGSCAAISVPPGSGSAPPNSATAGRGLPARADRGGHWVHQAPPGADGHPWLVCGPASPAACPA
jgi:hypothetical protein